MVSIIRNIVFSLLACIFLLGPCALLVSQKVELEIPDWLTAAEASYLVGAREEPNMVGAATIDGFKSRQFQSELEACVDNSVPMKAAALLGNAALQRMTIANSNAVFRWECYPTFFGSEYVFIPQFDALSVIPSIREDAYIQVKDLCEEIERYANTYPSSNFCFFIVDYSLTSEANPAMEYVSNCLSTDDIADLMTGLLANCSNVNIRTKVYDSTDDYYSDFFKSDHHWNAKGALGALSEIVDDDEIVDMLANAGNREVNGPLYSGSSSRNSLCLIDDKPIDFSVPFNNVDLERTPGFANQNGSVHDIYQSATRQQQHYQFYELYYQMFNTVNGIEGDKCQILVTDSYGYALLRPLGLAYEKTYVYNHMFAASSSSEKLSDIMEMDPDASQITFIGHAGNYISFLSRNPSFFDVGI